MSDTGCGVCRVGDIVVFVNGAVTGEECEIKIIKTAKSYCVAAITRLITRSPYRAERKCPLKACGGCVFQGITPEYELLLKQQFVQAAFKKEGIEINVLPTASAGGFSAYRNKAQFPVGNGKNGLEFGFYSEYTHKVIPCAECCINPPEFSSIARDTTDFFSSRRVSAYDEQTGRGLIRNIYIRKGKSGLLLTLVINVKNLPEEEAFVSFMTGKYPMITGILINENTENTNVILGKAWRTLYGVDYLIDTLCGRSFKISAKSFYQVNRECCELMYNKASELLCGGEGQNVVDLYCGIGTVGLCAAKQAKSLTGIEIIPEAVEDARENAERNKAENAEFLCGDSSLIKTLPGTADTVIVDPPRKGLSDSVISSLVEISPEKILYISCNPSTLARDVKLLAFSGYTAHEAHPFNMFPRTSHVETVVLMSRAKNQV